MSDLSDALATCRTIWATLADEGWEYGYGLNALDAVMGAARLVSEAPEWLQRLLEDPPPEPDEVSWCEVHFCTGYVDWCWARVAGAAPAKTACRMVRRRLLKPEKEGN